MAARRIEQPAILREREARDTPEEQDAQGREQPAEQESQAPLEDETTQAGDTSPAEPNPSTAPEAKPGESGQPRATEPTLFVQGEVKSGTTIPIGVEQAQDGPGMFTVEFPNEVRTYYRARPDEGFSINASVSGKYRVTLRQANENGDLRVVGKPLTFEVP